MGILGNILDAAVYNERTPVGKRKYAEQDAREYSDVWEDVENTIGSAVDSSPMRTAEILLRSGNPTAIKTGNAIMQNYHNGKTGDIKEHEYGLTLDEDQKEDWLRSRISTGDSVIGSSVKVRRPDGSVGYSIVRQDPKTGGVFMQDLGSNAYVEDKVINVGGGMQSLYRTPQGKLTYGPSGDKMSQANGYQQVDPEMEAEFNAFLRNRAMQQANQQPQGGPQPGGSPRYSPPGGSPQNPRPLPTAQPQKPAVFGGRGNFIDNVHDVSAADEQGKLIGRQAGQVRASLQQDTTKLGSLFKKHKVIMPEIDKALEVIGKKGGLTGGNFATGGIMELDAIKNAIPFGGRFPSVTEMVGTDAQALAQNLNVIRTNVAFDRLQEMRDDSPTGGALGQVSDMENQMLKDSLVSLDQRNRPEVMVQNLQKVKYHYERVLNFLKVDYLMKHKYKVSEGRTDYNDFMTAQKHAIYQVFGDSAETKELIKEVEQLQFAPDEL